MQMAMSHTVTRHPARRLACRLNVAAWQRGCNLTPSVHHHHRLSFPPPDSLSKTHAPDACVSWPALLSVVHDGRVYDRSARKFLLRLSQDRTVNAARVPTRTRVSCVRGSAWKARRRRTRLTETNTFLTFQTLSCNRVEGPRWWCRCTRWWCDLFLHTYQIKAENLMINNTFIRE